MSRLSSNIIYNYISQGYTALVGVVFIPYFIKSLGNEAYGLVGFFVSLQAWFLLLDMGLSAVVLRETTKYAVSGNKENSNKLEFASLCYFLNVLFCVVSIVIVTGFYFANDYFSDSWFRYQELDRYDVKFSLFAMGLFISAKWLGGLYRGVVWGVEDFKNISKTNILTATLRYLLVVLIFYLYKADIKIFFIVQVFAGLVELLLLYLLYKKIVPKEGASLKDGFTILRSRMGFAAYAGLGMVLYVISTQFDKIYLSRVLTLDSYGVFSFAIVFATLINMIAAPVQHSFQPRITNYYLTQSRREFFAYYRKVFSLFSIVMIVVCGCVVIVSVPVFQLLGYSAVETYELCSVVFLYSCGNALFAVTSMSYFMQYSQGVLKYHFFGVLVFSFCYVFFILVFTKDYGYKASGFFWVLLNLFYMVFWLPYINKKLLSEYSLNIYLFDVAKTIVLPMIFLLGVSYGLVYFLSENIYYSSLISLIFMIIYVFLNFILHHDFLREAVDDFFSRNRKQ